MSTWTVVLSKNMYLDNSKGIDSYKSQQYNIIYNIL